MIYNKAMEKQVVIKGRLFELAEYIENSEYLADIGCDHGRLCVWLLQQGRTKKAVASDISKASLHKAEELCALCGLSDRMQTVLADGLVGIPGTPDTIIIAGMGGELISQILENGKTLARNAKSLIFQPMRGIPELRQYLHNEGFSIVREKLCREGRHMYQLIHAVYSGEKQIFRHLPDGFYEFGDIMVEEKDVLLCEYLQMLRAKNQLAFDNAARNGIVLEHQTYILKCLDDIERKMVCQ